MLISRLITTCLCVCALMAALAYAGEREEALIDRTVEAYGGDGLADLETLVISDIYKGFRFGQSHDPGRTDQVLYKARTSMDFGENRKAFQWVRGQGQDVSTQHRLFDGRQGYVLDHTNQTVGKDASISFASADRQVSYLLDTVLVKLLDGARKSATYQGEVMYRGERHEKISFQAEGHPELLLYLHQETGLIHAMARAFRGSPEGYVYAFSDYDTVNGIVFAADTYVTREGLPFYVLVSREVEAGVDIEESFAIPETYEVAGAMLDFTEMSVNRLADGVYLAGANWGFSIFVDAGDYFIASGGYDSLQDRFAAVQAFAGVEKPLKYQIVSHHHRDHLSGMPEAAELGVTFVTVEAYVDAIRESAGMVLEDSRFMIIDGTGSVSDGLVKLIDIPNGHASHNLVSYVPGAKTVFTADMFLSRQETGAPAGDEGLIRLRDALAAHNIEAESFAAAHSARVLTAADLEASIASIKPAVCPESWAFCAG